MAPEDIINNDYYGPISKAMASSGKLLEKQIKQNLKENNNVGATGQLINAINSSDARMEGKTIVVRVGAGGVPYAAAVEAGSDPREGRVWEPWFKPRSIGGAPPANQPTCALNKTAAWRPRG